MSGGSFFFCILVIVYLSAFGVEINEEDITSCHVGRLVFILFGGTYKYSDPLVG